jgi:putative oxidoreductase
MNKFPSITSALSLIVLRVCVAMMFFLHALVRIVNGSIGQFSEFLNGKGFIGSTTIVWFLTAFEIVGGIVLALGYFKMWLACGFMLILVGGIVLIHAQLGWFVGEHGTGGVEYSLVLIAALLVVATDKK